VDPNVASDACGADELVDEFGSFRFQLRELVDDEHQVRQRIERLAASTSTEVGVEIVATDRSQHRLSSLDFGLKRHERAACEIAVEVGDRPDQVRQLLERSGGAATFVIHQYHHQV